MGINVTDFFIDGLIRKSESISESVFLQAKNCLLDYLGVLAGGRMFLNEKHPELIEAFSEKSMVDFAFLSGFAAHVLELDDGHRMGMIHLGSSIISSVLAIAESDNRPGLDVLMGIIMGYEAAVRCAMALQPGHKERGYHVSGTCGTIGSAMGVGFACHYSKAQLKSTLVCAVSSAAGILEIQEQASEMKPYNVGRAALDGVVSGQMGRLALDGPDDILGGNRGFLATFTDTPKPSSLVFFPDEAYCIESIYKKVYAACRHCHPAIDATLSIRNDVELYPEQVYELVVHTYKLAVRSHNHTLIQGVSSAKLSIPFSVALAIVKGNAGYADYNDANIKDPLINHLTRMIKVVEDESLTKLSPAVRGARVTIKMKNGAVYEASCLYPKGEPENPLSHKELEDKFRGLALYGRLSKKECDEVIQEVRKEDINISKIIRIVCK